MKRATLAVLALLIIATAFYGCGKSSKVLAVVNGKSITQKDFDDRVANISPAMKQVIMERKKEFLSEMILETLFLEEAAKKNIANDPEVKKLVNEAKKKIMIARLMDIEAQAKASVTNEEIEKFYNDNKDKFQSPLQIRASQIQLETKEKAEEVLAKLKKGENFEQLAKEYSVDQTKDRGGDVGYFMKGQLIPEFENACFNMNKGETSGVVKTPLGYHIIKITDMQEARLLTLDEVREAIKNQIMANKKREAMAKFIQELRDKSKIKIMDEPAQQQSTAVPEKTTAPAQETSTK